MQAIETLEQFEQAAEKLVTAHTSLDRAEVIAAIKLAITGHPMEALALMLLDGLCSSSHNLAGREQAVADLRKILLGTPTEEMNSAQRDYVETIAGSETPPETETVHYADGSSATGPGPLPQTSPEGAPAVDPPATVPVVGETTADPETPKPLEP